MTKPVSGFLSEDGTFFTSFQEAFKHDAEMRIRAECAIRSLDADKLLDTIEALADPVKDYLKHSQSNVQQTEVATSEDED